jgi:hypothetical protein
VTKTITPLFLLLDDDFEFEEDSHLDILFEIFYTYQHINIIAGKIPEDIREFQDFSGVFLRYGRTLALLYNVSEDREEQMLFPRSADEKMNDGSRRRQVDFVPNVFMGRTEAFGSVRWDDDLKLGEYKDFFLRFREVNRSVYSCQYINVHHHQNPSWEKVNDHYYKKRKHVFK